MPGRLLPEARLAAMCNEVDDGKEEGSVDRFAVAAVLAAISEAWIPG